MAATITDEQIFRLHSKAVDEQDWLLACLCERALDTHPGLDNVELLTPDQRAELLSTTIGEARQRCAAALTATDDRSTWLRTGPLTQEQREATIASLREGLIDAQEAAALLGCTESEARAAALSREPDRYTVSRRVPSGWIADRIGVSEYDAACVVGITRWTGAGVYRMTGTGVYWVQDQREPRTVAPEVRS